MPPFRAENHVQLLRRIESGPVQFPRAPSISTDCANLLRGLLTPDPIKRLSFDDFFAHRFWGEQKTIARKESKESKEGKDLFDAIPDAAPPTVSTVQERARAMIDCAQTLQADESPDLLGALYVYLRALRVMHAESRVFVSEMKTYAAQADAIRKSLQMEMPEKSSGGEVQTTQDNSNRLLYDCALDWVRWNLLWLFTFHLHLTGSTRCHRGNASTWTTRSGTLQKGRGYFGTTRSRTDNRRRGHANPTQNH